MIALFSLKRVSLAEEEGLQVNERPCFMACKRNRTIFCEREKEEKKMISLSADKSDACKLQLSIGFYYYIILLCKFT
jgi:hypothetical protein